VRGDQVDLAVAAGRVHHAELKEYVGLRGVADTGFEHLVTSHFLNSLSKPREPNFFRVSLVRVMVRRMPAALNRPLNGVLNLPQTKFEFSVNSEIIKDRKPDPAGLRRAGHSNARFRRHHLLT
jgi:hypothetical protein